MDKKEINKLGKLRENSVEVLKKYQLKNGAILASSPNGRYPYVYPRDHSMCILALIEEELYGRAEKALRFALDNQNKNGSFPQRLDRKGNDLSYKPIQLDNVGLVLYAFSKYVKATGDKSFLKKYKTKIKNSISYLHKNLHKKNLFFTPNSIHEFPPIEEGLEVWTNGVCLGALKELNDLGIKCNINLEKVKKSIEKYLWNGDYFIKNIRLKESSSVVDFVDVSSYALVEFGIFDNDNIKIESTVKKIEEELWNKKLGGICRYEKFVGRNNGGWGPWPHFTLMIAKHYIKIKNKRKADKYLRWILKISCKNYLPEHIATKREFEEWVVSYRKAGIIRKDREIMIKNIRKSEPYKKGIAYSVLPLVWPHAEFIRTWKLYKEVFVGNLE